ncbi:extracellular solute-binding protein, family 3 [Porphyromonadaceae bacterium NLAE-zl-C104]|uniref:transporter substrate-binding domain-containing protein n=1 Tax=Proteiniphilum TaxID=294702 RepID=UPI0008953DD7|nr:MULTISPECIES: transporter substrate-binding domain-containing protein [Proteiniphilum]MDY9919119.1 transporter substrate-binding domain-containing protein [Proteiniphilum sp.]SDZ96139.1 extracellular solute-binding protein, family 3 [Porphyromonadaceae bacterium KH3R12]SFS83839.1 extracellular solute-binding protein, family 3 [Porphyromonadaceae bacterium NLAE-zl-C104]
MQNRKRLYLYLLLLIVAIVAMILLRTSMKGFRNTFMAPRDYNEIISSGELNVVTDYNSIGLYASGDSLQGFQREMILALEKEWGIKVNLFLENSLDENLEGLLTMRYDLVARNIPVNIKLKDTFAFTNPITLNKQVLVQRKQEYNDSVEPIRQHLDLAGKTIRVANDSPVILRLNNLSHEIGDTIFIVEDPTYETEQLVMMVASGDIDFTVCDEKMAIRLAKVLPEIDIETDISFTQLESWSVRKDSPVLLDSLNSWLDRFKTTPAFKRIYRKYY